jgi:hypothetical protein
MTIDQRATQHKGAMMKFNFIFEVLGLPST